MTTRYIPLILLAALSITGYASSVSAQVTLDQCIQWGLERNPSLQRTTLEKQLDKPGAMAAWGQFLPSVYVGYGIDQSKYYSPTYVDADGKVVTLPYMVTTPDTTIVYEVPEGKRRNSSYFVTVEEILFDGGRNYLNLKNSSLVNRSRHSSIEHERFVLRSEITRAFAQAIAAQRRLELAAKVVDQRRLQLRLAETRFETGSVTKRDVLQAEVDLGRALSDSLSTVLERRRTFEELNILVDLPLDTSYSFAELPQPFKPDWDAETLTADAVKLRGDLRSAELAVMTTHNDHLAAKGDYLPSLTASYFNSRSEKSGADVAYTLKPSNRYSEVGLNLRWTLFDRFTRSLKLQEAKVRNQQAKLTAFELDQNVRHQVRVASDQMISLYEQVQVAAQNSRWAEETLKFEQERYRLGSATVIELGTAQISFIQAKNDQIDLETQFYVALGELELATGKVLR